MAETIVKNTYALIKVSTKEQNETRQVIRMTKLGTLPKNIVIEKENKNADKINRCSYASMIFNSHLDTFLKKLVFEKKRLNAKKEAAL